MYTRILLPLDGSVLAEQALPHAIAQAKRFQAELFLLRVLEPLTERLGRYTRGVREAEETTRNLARQYLERRSAEAKESGISVHADTLEGRPHRQILQFVQANQVDLIVICTRGHSGFSRWLMGSVADRVVRGADVPVLLVHATRETENDHGESQ
jgi:nucleotide-binding universal stress UspA family protein